MAEDDVFVMVVDDEVDNLELLGRMLRKQFKVHSYSIVKQAMEALTVHPYSVIVSDYRMPEMNGVDFLALASEKVPHALRILVTAFADLSVALAAVNRARVSSILCKPIKEQELLRDVMRCDAFYRGMVRLRARVRDDSRRNRELKETLAALKKR
jgi:response regulator RpfG family c-di-GMP phosphodiesterase